MNIFKLLGAPVVGASVLGGVSAGVTALSGLVGTSVLSAAGYAGYVAAEAANMGLVGGAVVGGSIGLVAGSIFAIGDYDLESLKGFKLGFGTSMTGEVASTVVLGLVGYGILNNTAATATLMELGKTAAAFAVGGAIMAVPVSALLVCVAIPLAGCAMAALATADCCESLCNRV